MEKTEKTTEKQEKKGARRDQIHFDYKNTELIKEHINPHARIMSRRRTKLAAGDQRRLAEAVKRARFMALIPYISR